VQIASHIPEARRFVSDWGAALSPFPHVAAKVVAIEKLSTALPICNKQDAENLAVAESLYNQPESRRGVFGSGKLYVGFLELRPIAVHDLDGRDRNYPAARPTTWPRYRQLPIRLSSLIRPTAPK